MKAMIFAAGLGTRLRPITNTVPKAMVEVGGVPMLKIILDRCRIAGIKEVVVNVHYLSQVIIDFIDGYEKGEMNIFISDESDEILETGGGLLKASALLKGEEPFLVCNADILTNIDLEKFLQYHQAQGGLATLAVRDRPSSRKLLFDEQFRLLGRANGAEGEEWAFSGYHIIEPSIFEKVTRTGKFSITDWYIDICQNEKIVGYDHTEDLWVDIGNFEKLEEARVLYHQFKEKF